MFYIFRNLEYFGPFNFKELQGLVSSGKLCDSDLLCSAQDKIWRLASEVLNGQFSRKLQQTEYVILHQIRSGEYVTRGPMSEADLVEALKLKQLRAIDYVWQDGWPEWRRIQTLEQFVPKQEIVDCIKPEHFFKLIPFDRLKDNPWIYSEAPPADATGVDLVAGSGIRPFLNP